MPRLRLALLGPFEAALDGQPIVDFRSEKISENTRALLAYLAVESGRPHRRESLATLLWPERPEEQALANLRRALSYLRTALGEQRATSPFLIVTRNSVQFDRASDHWMDVHAFRELLTPDDAGQRTVARLEQAVALYRAHFLEGFASHGSAALEEWLSLTRDDLTAQMQDALRRLAALHEGRGDYARAESLVRRQLALEPWREEAHRDLMRVLALAGRRSAALAHFEICRHALAEELDVEPGQETVALHAHIRDGSFAATFLARPQGSVVPSSPPPAGTGVEAPRATFVARQRELAQLEAHLTAALDGRGRVAFVVGDAGSGKTALLTAFARQTMARHGSVVVAGGSCNVYRGAGDPYLPFREVLQLLAGDVEAKRAGGSISAEQARRLWALFPTVLEALVGTGPALVDLFVPGAGLLERAQGFSPLGEDDARLARLERLLEHPARAVPPGSPRVDLFEQVTRVLQQVARRQALLLLLDDLQWADPGTLSLLFHLGRRLDGNRILVLGAYRGDEVAQGRDGAAHPLGSVVAELQRDFGEILVDLDQAAGRPFVEALLNTKPNRLSPVFRERLAHQTGGHALFTVELLRGLEERGDLAQDEQGRWVEARPVDWETLPPRVEAVIAERFARLPVSLQRTLEVASLQGEEFAAEVIARVLSLDDGEVYRRLSGPLSRQHGLVTARSLRRLDGHRLSCYGFRHHLFQRYVYSRLDQIDRASGHEVTGLALEALYGGQAGEIAVELARHFETAGLPAKAAPYLLRAGRRALDLAADAEAQTYFRRGLAVLDALPASADRDHLERDLQLGLGSALYATEGLVSTGKIAAYSRAHELSRRLGPSAELWPALHALASASTARGDYARALALSEELLELVQQSGEPAQLALGHFTLGERLFAGGDLLRAREHLEHAILHYERVGDSRQRRFLTDLKGFDLGVNASGWLAMTLWILGYPDQALQRSQEALRRARVLDHLLSLVLGLYAVSQTHHSRGEDRELRAHVEELAALMHEHPVLVGDTWVDVFSGWLEVRDGHVAEGLARMARGKAAWEATGAVFGSIAQSIVFVEACLNAGRPGDALPVLGHAVSVMETAGLHTDEAELHRLQGELRLARGRAGDADEAEAYYRRALEVAEEQQAKSWELRAAMSLACLWHRQGRSDEARDLLAGVYGWFTEGFDTADLGAARALLTSLPVAGPSDRLAVPAC
jgi:DNA-binding SARP family transcriptional activator